MMKMKLMTLGVAAALAVGSVGIACATPVNLVQNGDFSNTSLITSTRLEAYEIGNASGQWSGYVSHGQFVNDWTLSNGTANQSPAYAIWYPNVNAAHSPAYTRFWDPSSSAGANQRLPDAVGAPPTASGSGSFVALDGPQQYRAEFQQTIDPSGLKVGQAYKVSFWWGATDEMSKQGPTNTFLTVSFGNNSFDTATQHVGTHDFSGWMHGSFNFRYLGTNNVLSFLSTGTPGSLPPMALLTGVSMHAVPEPTELGMFGIGLLGLGVLSMVGYRRKQRRNDTGDGDTA